MKQLTRAQLESRKAQAVRFVRDVLGDPDRADEIDTESLEDYAERRRVKLVNSSFRRKAIMARGKTKADLEAKIADLQDENQELQEQLDTIADIVAGDEDGDEDEDTDSDSEEDDEDEEDDDLD